MIRIGRLGGWNRMHPSSGLRARRRTALPSWSHAIREVCYAQVDFSKKHVLGTIGLNNDDHSAGKKDIEQWLAEQLSA
ncbi:unnamed protein product [Musa hybrid cultivar]